MIKISQLLIVVVLLFGAPYALACDYPTRTDVPNGSSATKDEMIQGQRNVKSYMAAMEEYLACIESAEQETVAGKDDLDWLLLAQEDATQAINLAKNQIGTLVRGEAAGETDGQDLRIEDLLGGVELGPGHAVALELPP